MLESGPPVWRGFLVEDGRVLLLEELPGVAGTGWSDLRPLDINDRGWIVGEGTNPEGLAAGFLLIP